MRRDRYTSADTDTKGSRVTLATRQNLHDDAGLTIVSIDPGEAAVLARELLAAAVKVSMPSVLETTASITITIKPEADNG